MENHPQKGQILIELIAALAIILTFITVSLAFYQDDQKASYRYLISQPLKGVSN